MENLIIVEKLKDWHTNLPEANVITAQDYFNGKAEYSNKNIRIFNLCRSYGYLTTGYYVSLLAEARDQRVMPSLQTVVGLNRKSIYSLSIDFLNKQIDKAVTQHNIAETTNKFVLDIIFGLTDKPALRRIAQAIYEIFPSPLLQVEFKRGLRWQVSRIKPLYLNKLSDEQQTRVCAYINSYLGKRWRKSRKPPSYKYDLAILYNPNELLPPSDKEALDKFVEIGAKMGIHVELIKKKDINRLNEFDALFIRETTAIEHHTFKFASIAANEGLVVIDDPQSIVKCTNKVFLAELLQRKKIGTPRTDILTEQNYKLKLMDLPYPLVLKIPDGSFSRGVYKAETPEEAMERCRQLFKDSDILISQEYMYTEYDWRIGILNRKPLFACQYFMSPSHWQIVNHASADNPEEGTFRCVNINEVPTGIISEALKAANAIGDSFYGVDVKQTDRGIVVIEVNDNPNFEEGVENQILGDEFYAIMLNEFVRRIELTRGKQTRE